MDCGAGRDACPVRLSIAARSHLLDLTITDGRVVTFPIAAHESGPLYCVCSHLLSVDRVLSDRAPQVWTGMRWHTPVSGWEVPQEGMRC